MKSFLLKVGLISAIIISPFNGKVFAETTKTVSNTDWSTKCPQLSELNQNENPSFQHINCLLTYAAISADIPPEIVKSIAFQESGWQQFINGKPNVTIDGGIGIMQVTDSGYETEKLKSDIVYNIQVGIDILNEKYSWTKLPKIKGANRSIVENWYFPVMAYNGIVQKNSPIIKTPGVNFGKRNKDAYQEKVFKYIEQYSFADDPQIKFGEFPFKADDFEYVENSNEIKFNVLEYTFPEPFHPTSFPLIKGDIAVVRGEGVKLRSQPTRDSVELDVMGKYRNLYITDEIRFDESDNKNHFVWYPVKTVDGKIVGYTSSAYLVKKNDFENPVVSGVVNDKYYKNYVEIKFNEGVATLNRVIINSGYIATKEGNYDLVIKDFAGNTTSVNFTIDKTFPEISTLNTITDQSTSVIGKTEPNSKVDLYINSKLYKSIKANSTGSFTFPISKQKSDTIITVIPTDKAENIGFERTVKVLDRTKPTPPYVNKITSKTTVVTGTAEKGTTVYIYYGSKTIGKPTLVPSTGKFKVNIRAQKSKSILRVYVVDKAGNKSVERRVVVY